MTRFFERRRWRQALLTGIWLISISAMSAEGEFNFDVSSPSVMTIRKSLAERFAILKENFQSGVIGLTNDGLIAIREPGSLARDVRIKIEQLVADDNKDRGTLYREIARANGRPDWESQFQAVFAERWISRAPVGWYHRESSGHWIKKLSRGANGDAPGKTNPDVPFPGS